MWKIEHFVAGILFSAGCAAVGPSEALIQAREMERRAEQSRAPELAPAQLRQAEQMLARAEAEHRSDPQSIEEKHLSYLAISKFENAIAEARRRHAVKREEEAHRRYFTEQAQVRRRAQQQLAQLQSDYEQVKKLLESTQTELDQVHNRIATERDLERAQREQLESQRRTLDEQVQILDQKRLALEEALQERDVELDAERDARMRAEAQAKEALERLQEVAAVREAEEGTIITLTGEVLFATGKSELLPTARMRLKAVADALKMQDEKVAIVVEGHTDSQGPDRMNEELSYARADAVKRYLVEEGVASDRIRAVGRGEREPIATNRTPEGRANNRRVEIILQEEI